MEDKGLLNFWGNDWITFGFIVLVVTIAAIWRIFEKAGKQGWTCIIPFYNVVILLEIVGKPWWWLLIILFVPIGNIVFFIWALNLLSLSFGKNEGFTVGLYFLPFIFFPILGFGNADYKGPAGAPKSF
jgi:hypothetical protein